MGLDQRCATSQSAAVSESSRKRDSADRAGALATWSLSELSLLIQLLAFFLDYRLPINGALLVQRKTRPFHNFGVALEYLLAIRKHILRRGRLGAAEVNEVDVPSGFFCRRNA